MKNYIFNVFIALDQLINAILLGDPDQTISSRLYYLEENKKRMGIIFRPVVDFMFKPWSKHHCYDAAMEEFQDAQLYLLKNTISKSISKTVK